MESFARAGTFVSRCGQTIHRSPSASTATGSFAAHRLEQEALLNIALRKTG